MNNFFYNNSEYSLFKRALRATKGEPVVINISSNDASLSDDNSKQEEQIERKVMSQKFEPSPFGKFFGPRKARTAPVDMNDYSSWKNKNYRQAEQNINSHPEEKATFSLSDYMNRNFSENKFNEEDQLKHDNQKPIDQLSNDDPVYKRFSLDSYLNKLEEQNKVQTDYESNNDLLEPLKDVTQDFNTDSSQDEEFDSTGDVDVEQVALDEHLGGDKFSFDKSELEKVRNRIEKLEKEANNIKDKPTEKVINTNELTDKLDLEKLGVSDEDKNIGEDDIEKTNKKINSASTDFDDIDENDENKQTPKVSHKKFMEINKTPETAISKESEANDKNKTSDSKGVFDADDELNEIAKEDDDANASQVGEMLASDENEESEDNSGDVSESDETGGDSSARKQFVSSGTKVERGDIVTKDDLKTFGDEFMQKFTKLYTEHNTEHEPSDENFAGEGYDEGYAAPYSEGSFVGDPNYANPMGQQMQPVEQPNGFVQNPTDEIIDKQNELQSKLLEMIEANKKSDEEAKEKLKQAEIEKAKLAESYEERLKELEQSIKKRDEEFKQQAYLDKLKSDIKLKKAETNFKRREERIKEFEKSSSEKQKFGVMLKKELENNINISNLEMDKKLLEVASKIKKEEEKEDKIIQVNVVQEPTKEKETHETKPKVAPKPKKKTTRKSSHSHTRSPRRKIDSDIIGGINFD